MVPVPAFVNLRNKCGADLKEASVQPGGGLHGIERRLSAFDGTVFLSTPLGGPTIVTMELPCALSSEKI
jgi:hypothetical protein